MPKIHGNLMSLSGSAYKAGSDIANMRLACTYFYFFGLIEPCVLLHESTNVLSLNLETTDQKKSWSQLFTPEGMSLNVTIPSMSLLNSPSPSTPMTTTKKAPRSPRATQNAPPTRGGDD